MTIAYDLPTVDPDFRPRATLLIALGALVLIVPLAALHFLQGNDRLGLVSLCVIGVLGFNAWYLQREAPPRPLPPRLVIAAAGILLDLYLLATQGTSGLLWGYPTVLWLYSTLPERAARIANAVLLAGSLPLITVVAPADVAPRAIITLIGVSLFSCVLVHVISRQQERLQRQLRHDPLTGLLNRHALADTVERAIARASRDGVPMALLAIDLDHFKRVNDQFGHAAGDEVLRGLGALLRTRLRASDTVFRLGGEEFLVLLHDTVDVYARWVAELLLAEIRETPLLDGHPITASIGLAPYDDEVDAERWIAHADEALYRAKHAGRDRVANRYGQLGAGPRPTIEPPPRHGAPTIAASPLPSAGCPYARARR